MGLQFLRVGIPASVISDMDAPMRSLGGRTVPDGAVGILPATMMVVFVYTFQKGYIILFFFSILT